jgi:hypothetical protein
MKDMERSNQDDINARFNRGSTRKSYREQLKLMHDELNDPNQFDIGEHIVKLLERLQLKMIILNFENVIFHSRYSGALKVNLLNRLTKKNFAKKFNTRFSSRLIPNYFYNCTDRVSYT